VKTEYIDENSVSMKKLDATGNQTTGRRHYGIK